MDHPYAVRQWRTSTNYADSVYFGSPWEPAALVAQKRALNATIRDEVGYMVPNTFQGRRDMRIQVKFMF